MQKDIKLNSLVLRLNSGISTCLIDICITLFIKFPLIQISNFREFIGLEKNNFSALHKIKSEETWHFYAGDPLEVIEINEHGELKKTNIGSGLEQGELFQYTVKANTWFGSRVLSGGEFSLVGCTVAPGFDFRDFEMAKRKQLILQFPKF